MKKFFLLSFLGIAISSYVLYEVNVLDFHHILNRCTGSKYCKICTNCSRCGYCNGGGTCGVCYVPRAVVRRSIPVKSYKSKKLVSSVNAHSIGSGKSVAKRYSLSRKMAPVDQTLTQLSSPKDSTESNFVVNTSTTNKIDSKNDLEPVTMDSPNAKEYNFFTIDIPENADFVRITAIVANLREEISTKSRILQKLKHGDLLIRLKTVKGWVKVQTLDSGEVGYVSRNLLN